MNRLYSIRRLVFVNMNSSVLLLNILLIDLFTIRSEPKGGIISIHELTTHVYLKHKLRPYIQISCIHDIKEN